MSIYAQPYRPSLATATALASMGDDFQKMYLLREKEEGDLRLADKKAQLSREEMRERLALEWENKSKELAEKARIAEETRGRYMDYVGAKKPKEEEFTKDYSQYDELGQEQKVFDKEGFKKARDEWGRQGIIAETLAVKPEAYDDVAKGMRTDMFTERMRNDGTPEGSHKWAIAEGGKPRFGVDEGMPVDQMKGVDEKPTPVGQSTVNRNEAAAKEDLAQAGKHNADAAKAKKEGSGKTNDPRYKALESQYNRAEQEVSRLAGLIKDYEIAAANPAQAEALTPKIAEAKAAMKTAVERRNDLAKRLDEWTEDSPGSPTPKPGNRKPLDAFKR